MKRHCVHPAQGLALPTLLGLLSLGSLAALLAMRQLWLSEQSLNAAADQLRVLHMAHAVLPLAVQDIVEAVPTQSTGLDSPNGHNASVDSVNTISSNSNPASSHLRHSAGDATQTHVFFPSSMADYEVLRQRLGSALCREGICAPAALNAAPSKASDWQARMASAMPLTASDIPYSAANNAVNLGAISNTPSNGAGYWIEIFPQAPATTSVNDAAGANDAEGTATVNFIYRITVFASGVLPGNSTVLQAVWTRANPATNAGQWHSWQVLRD